MKRKYITTPIYYPNAKPHIGTAYTTVIADTLARYERLYGNEVIFTTGIDEHGQKIEEVAKKNNISPQEWVDNMTEDFKKLWSALNISYDKFVRTTSKEHIEVVRQIIQKVYDNGDIYLGSYKGKYCVSEETFVTESQLVDGKYLGKEVIDVEEPSYFFRLSKYADKLIKYYDDNENFIIPKHRKNEIVSFINQGLQDLSISRTSFDWGIPLEIGKGHIVYVWFDALNSYLTGANYLNQDEFNKTWNESNIVHFLGKDILRFHAMIWPAMLMSAGIKLPNHIAAHGWWTIEGEKMSKSLGNVVDPHEEIKKYGLDAFRYFLLRDSNFGSDSDYSKELVISRINSDLANDLGNLLNRTLGMQNKYFGDVIQEATKLEDIEHEIYSLYEKTVEDVYKSLQEFDFSNALKTIWVLVSRMNKYIDETAPWLLAKEENFDRLKTVMYTLFDMLRNLAYLLSPVLVESSAKILHQIGLDEKIEQNNIYNIGKLKANTRINEAQIIFPRIEKEVEEYKKDLKISNPIKLEDFSKVNIEVVEIEKVYEVENSNRLLRFIIKTKNEKRQVISGIAKDYKNYSELVGKKVLAVLNLEPVTIQGFVSQAMLLTTVEKKKTKLIEVDLDIKVGGLVK
ncbi:methionine--tRNA ligase [Oceanivirga miroungae]|uniref:Methionine--tRNA ligase n=1 Tax=Oceanivirga miroungae TaxID=1130046 RepID=A0A6I8MDD1_9FUSO|nr:methionine--tRNA ligase [Oceanivirga miroungae]VWL85461.1 methionyl-tRNA synthetase [Oceanivirga miroungae]